MAEKTTVIKSRTNKAAPGLSWRLLQLDATTRSVNWWLVLNLSLLLELKSPLTLKSSWHWWTHAAPGAYQRTNNMSFRRILTCNLLVRFLRTKATSLLCYFSLILLITDTKFIIILQCRGDNANKVNIQRESIVISGKWILITLPMTTKMIIGCLENCRFVRNWCRFHFQTYFNLPMNACLRASKMGMMQIRKVAIWTSISGQ